MYVLGSNNFRRKVIAAKLDLTRHTVPATQLLQWLSRCLVVLSRGHVINACSDWASNLCTAYLCHRGLSKSVKSRTCKSSEARPAGPIPPCDTGSCQLTGLH